MHGGKEDYNGECVVCSVSGGRAFMYLGKDKSESSAVGGLIDSWQ
jgi:hypothetical protein